jgi:hypothetical protein
MQAAPAEQTAAAAAAPPAAVAATSPASAAHQQQQQQAAPPAPAQAPPQQQQPSPTQFLRPHLLKLAAYTPIEPFEILSARYGRAPQDIVKLDANENPYGPPPEVAAALGSMPFPHIYPDPESRRLRAALAEWNDIPKEHLLVGAARVTGWRARHDTHRWRVRHGGSSTAAGLCVCVCGCHGAALLGVCVHARHQPHAAATAAPTVTRRWAAAPTSSSTC